MGERREFPVGWTARTEVGMSPMCAKNRFTGIACILALTKHVSHGVGGGLVSVPPSSNSRQHNQNKSHRKLQNHSGGFRVGKVLVTLAWHACPPWVLAQFWRIVFILVGAEAGTIQPALRVGDTHQPYISLSSTARWQGASPFAACLGGYLWAHIFLFFPGRFEEMDEGWEFPLIARAHHLPGRAVLPLTQQCLPEPLRILNLGLHVGEE